MAKVSVRNRNKNQVYKNGKKKPANWEYRFEKAPINGVRQNESKSGFKTQKEALEAGNKALAEYLNCGQVIKENEISVSDYLDEWFNVYVVQNLRNNTQTTYRNNIDKHIKPLIGQYKLSSLNSATLQKYSTELYKTRSPRHAEQILRLLKSALNYAVEPLQYIKVNPLAFIKKQRIQEKQTDKTILTNEQWKELIELFPEKHRFHVLLMIGYYTGIRVSEAMGLTWDNIDFENKTITINKQLVRNIKGKGKGSVKYCLGDPKTITSNRVIAISDTLLELLKREKIRQKTRRDFYKEYHKFYDTIEFKDNNGQILHEIIESPKDTLRFVCTDENGEHLNPNNIGTCLNITKRKLGFKFDYHSLRHTHATILVENGINPKTLQERLGHMHVQTTLTVYTHNTKRMDYSAAAMFEAATRGQN